MTRRYKLMLATTVLFFLSGVQASLWAKTVKVSLGTLAPKNSSYHRILVGMGQEWREAPGDGIRLKVYPSGVIGNESNMIREMRLGGIQAGLITASGLSDIDYSVGSFQSLPMMFHSLKEFEFVYKKMQPLMEKRLEAKGFIVLFWTDAGWVHFFTKNQLTTPEDLKGMKVFAASNVSETSKMWQAGGYHPVAIDAADIPMGLQTGMIDAVSVPPIYAMAARMDQVAKHMLDIKWAPLIVAAVMHKNAWDQLAPETQAFVKTTALKAGTEMIAKGRQEGQESVAAMVKRGLKVQHITPEVETLWIKAAAELHDKLRGGLVPAEIYDEVQRLLKEYRAAQP